MSYSKKTQALVEKKGRYIRGTREIIGFQKSFRFREDSEFWEKRIGADASLVSTFFGFVLKGETNLTLGPYQSQYYVSLPMKAEKAAEHFKSDHAFTRRAVIDFPASHCFSSIQLIVRPFHDTFKYTILVNMRSCNVVDNFANDLYLAYLVCDHMIKHAGLKGRVFPEKMIVSIGSLHKFIY